MDASQADTNKDGGPRELGWLRDLRADPAAKPVPVSDAPTRAAVEELIGAGALVWGIVAAREATNFILDSLPQFGGDSVAELLLARAVEATTLATLASFVDAEQTYLWPASEPADAVESYVHRGISLDSVIRGIHMLQEVLARQLLGAIWSPNRTSHEAQWSSDHLFRTFDGFTAYVAAYYMTKAQEWNASASQAHDALVEKLLDPNVDADLAAASGVLRYEVAGDHIACELWLGHGVDDTQAESAVQVVLQRLLLDSHTSGVLHRRPDHTTAHIWCQVSGRGAPDFQAAVHGVHGQLTVGLRGRGREGFQMSHRQAVLAGATLRLSAALTPDVSSGGSVASFDDLEVAALIATDLTMARQFVQRHLGELANLSPRSQELRETLAVYLENDRSVTRSARIVHAHRNTVVYRIKQAEDTIGSFEGKGLEIRLALRLAGQLGASVLRHED